MGISFGGLGSGLPPNIVDQLIEAERQPVKTMQTQKGKQENKLKLVTDLESKLSAITGSLSTLASNKGFQDIKLNSGDPNIIAGTVDPSVAASGSWNVEVMELAQKAAAITNGFPDKDKTEIGVGYFRFRTADGYQKVYISGESSTLQDAATAINNAKVGVKATVINDRSDPDNPYRLMISGDGTGNDRRIEYPTLYFLDGDQDIYFDKEQEAKNGRIKVDGFEFEISDNTINDLIPGVTLELRQSAPGRNVNLTVKEDLQVVGGKVKTFVDSVNAVLSFIQGQNRLDEKTDTTQTLGGDSLLSSIENRLRRLIQNPIYGVNGPITRLSQLGIEFNRNGTLDFKEDTFNNQLSKDPMAVQAFLAGNGFSTGFIPRIRQEVRAVLDSGFGPVNMRKKSLQDRITQIDKKIESKERQLGRREEQLKNQFAKLEETVSRLKSQGSALAGLGAAPSGNTGLGR